MKILFKYPSRGRSHRFFEGLDSIMSNLYDTENYWVSCTLDLDDYVMNTPDIIERISRYKNTSIEWGTSESKIDAFNRSFPDYDFDILVAVSDDIRFNIYGFDQMIRVDMSQQFPNIDGILHYNDQDAKDQLAVLYVAGKRWFEYRGRKIYHPSYKNFWCDNEEMLVSQILNKYHYCRYQILDHLCPGWGRGEKDELYLEQEKGWPEDEKNFIERKENNFYL